jgi:hypothetical protein
MDRRRGFSSGNNKRDRRGEQPEELEKRIPLPLAVLVCTRAAQRPRSHFETKTIFILALLHRWWERRRGARSTARNATPHRHLWPGVRQAGPTWGGADRKVKAQIDAHTHALDLGTGGRRTEGAITVHCAVLTATLPYLIGPSSWLTLTPRWGLPPRWWRRSAPAKSVLKLWWSRWRRQVANASVNPYPDATKWSVKSYSDPKVGDTGKFPAKLIY